MTTLFQAMVAAARALDALHESNATGGSTTTIIDTKLANLGWNSDDFNGGMALLIRDAGGAGAAPEGESRQITDFVSSGTITVDAFSAAAASGDSYGVMTSRYPRGLLVSKINECLAEYGDVPTEDITSLTTAASTSEYSLPVAAKKDLRQVWLARTTTANDYRWQAAMNCYVEHGAANGVGKLIFNYQPTSGYKIKLVYMAAHGYVQADTDVISDYVAVDWLAIATAVKCARFRLGMPGSDEKQVTAQLNDLMNREAKHRAKRRLATPQKFPQLGNMAFQEAQRGYARYTS